MRNGQKWAPALILASGVFLIQTVGRQRPMPLTTPLSTIPLELEGFSGHDVPVSKDEQRIAGMSSYVSRFYGPDSAAAFTLYVGYYESQTQGKTIHSPKNCLPGAGWEPVSAGRIRLEVPNGSVPVNRYVIAKKAQRALVYYWYQGRGRVSANEYKVKWELLRDASFKRRTDEALVRIIVPIYTTESDAEALARRIGATLVPTVGRILPS
jgi:EpsI family protein